MAVFIGGALAGCKPAEPSRPEPPPEQLTPEEKQIRREARELGTRLYSAVKEEPKTMVEEQLQQKKLAPVYEDIEKFIFRQLQPFKDRVASITVVYKNSGILCIVYVKPGDEEELLRLKRATDSCVGKIIDDLPLVRYLIVRNQSEQ